MVAAYTHVRVYNSEEIELNSIGWMRFYLVIDINFIHV